MSKLSSAILATLAYCDQFQYPLTLSEITERLISETTFSLNEIKSEVEKLVKLGKIIRTGLCFQLSNSPEWYRIRQARTKSSQEKWSSVHDFVSQIKGIPWVEGVAVTGSLAMDNAETDADIDFLIVTQPRRLWLTRLWISWIALKNGKKRSWHVEKPNSWCLNLWLDSAHLSMEKPFQSVYGAYEVVQAVWVFDRKGWQHQFYSQNAWISGFIPNMAAKLVTDKPRDLHADLRSASSQVGDSIISLLDRWAFLIQIFYMKRHMTREKVGRGMAFFHPRDTKKIVEKAWRTKAKEQL